MDRLDRAFWDHLISFDTPCFSGFFWGAPSDFIRASRRPRYHHFGSYDASSESWSNLMDLDGLKLLLSATSAELAELELKRYHWWLRYYEEWHGEAPRADKNSAVAQLLRSAYSAVAGESWRHLWGSDPLLRHANWGSDRPFDHFLLFYGTRTMGFIWTSHQVEKYGPRSVMFSGRPVLHGLCPWWESCAEGAIRVRSENWQNVDRVTVMRGYKSHDESMVLLYMVLHGSHQYTPFMLAYIPYMGSYGNERWSIWSHRDSDLIRSSQCHRFFSPSWPIFPPISTDCRWYFQHIFSIFSASVGSVVSRLLGSAARIVELLQSTNQPRHWTRYHPVHLVSDIIRLT